MIDFENENVVSLAEATKHLPRRRRGRRPAVATLYRWASHGLRGRRLETLQVGGTLCTSVEALQRFFDQLSEKRCHTNESPAKKERGRKEDEDLERCGW